ncbi:methyltransferase family protein [Pseudonocardia acaciae]|uniref:methyltransferase family protein n=1 Tax=Pseudonocardia acaciae TaxID=551276 RepID=UPI0005622A12|nr:isoprenylcysteine carboxylmethyltransferase family protein [Pseudonocardia acaciae]
MRLVLLDVCWGAFALVWLVGAVVNARLAPPVVRRRWVFCPTLVVAGLLLLLRFTVPLAVWRPLQYRAPWLDVVGAVLLVAATGFTLWARWRLGTMWTSTAVVKADHRLRTDGPYAITRHPIYTGLLGMLTGTVLLSGLGLWLVVLVVGYVFVEFKIRAEEQLLTSEFPDDYAAFRRRVPRLLPRPRSRRTHP